MKLSVIIATRDRSRQLRETLTRWGRHSSRQDWELVVVDSASSDDTAAVVQRFAGSSEVPVTVIREERPGWGRAKNAGARAAAGDILVSTDDDCYPGARYLDDLAAIFADPAIGYMGGRILLADANAAPVSIWDDRQGHIIAPGSFIPAGQISGGNMAFRRAVFDELGGFDEWFGAGARFAGGDMEFANRASVGGWTGGYFPGPVMYHHHGRNAGPDVQRVQRRYDKGRGACYAKLLLQSQAPEFYIRHWYWTETFRSPATLARELWGAAHYVSRRLLQHVTTVATSLRAEA